MKKNVLTLAFMLALTATTAFADGVIPIGGRNCDPLTETCPGTGVATPGNNSSGDSNATGVLGSDVNQVTTQEQNDDSVLEEVINYLKSLF